jgi:hypothetical protein
MSEVATQPDSAISEHDRATIRAELLRELAAEMNTDVTGNYASAFHAAEWLRHKAASTQAQADRLATERDHT